ncbi:AcrB/AcrD/AcrF family protein [Sphingomonas sp. BN140010]|uniref:AcrB/AcrD/AcrF family protein n=1 Tax=Sphingomonas arvum TaxID=2992113 RepID=A0ABT3JFS4_9SPHN|nr:AcrB/AcrD/AcrF family protein [Sphingomonas sp. BN140010]MCW3797851.1 AcrB/AcrD/AcrF family protein [Sphingomonas sp. BN140010]
MTTTTDKILAWTAKNWRWLVLIYWWVACAWFVYSRWRGIELFQLNDTDDNLRLAQVRAWMHGQGWYDLRQYRLDPPAGANIHWSRIVDLPLAGLITILRWVTSGPNAERFAIAVAPLLPYLPICGALALTARRLIHPAAFVAVLAALFFAGSVNGMVSPTRIDHHGWQLACLAIALAGLADPDRRRGGLTVGLATALSLSIGLEMLIYLALAAAAQVLMWVDDRGQRERLACYAVSLAGGCTVGFLLFASYANRAPVCDALSPVWLSDALLGGALLWLVATLSPERWTVRLGMAAVAGVIVAAFHALAWPHCLHRLEGVSPEVAQLWLNNVREAKPIYEHGWRTVLQVVTLPAVGALGWLLLTARNWRVERDLFRRTAAVAVVSIVPLALLLWQTRAGPSAQLLGCAGAAALVWLLLPRAWHAKNWLVASIATAVLVVAGLGAAVPFAFNLGLLKSPPQTRYERQVARANSLCPSMRALRPIAKLPKGTIFTFLDLGPRIITVTHHNAIAGPYHRNGEAIADLMKAFRGSEAQAHQLVAKHRADYLLICPMMSQATIFMARAPQGFYAQLVRGRVPGWLQPIPLPKDSPFRIWRVRPASGSAPPPRPDSRG